ncbi:hypothetical protein D0N36_14260 [Hymenobacter lapidiphilus]|uniref:hypothetical protein n=1 Tax=Hymenobacter sp. CCM 8763 TaxID=2303334 RepID=UPI000E348968|nr:hypothetical protein [Hymenobacter sp. CCM 8763]RFP64350.1 hypothetical protein D0N36_14260 [Hymenobacter sp. CCM 8763]
MNNTVREHLIDLAHASKTISYQELANACGLGLDMGLAHHRNAIAVILGDIGTHEYQAGRPVLSAVAVFKNTFEHGKGFYALCEQLGIGNAKKLERDIFGVQQITACHEFWKEPQHYQQFK